MSGDDRVRFCAECGKHVYNLSAMTTAEASALVEQKEGRMCARYYQRVDGSVLTSDCPVGLRLKITRVSRRAAAVFSGLGFAASAFAQSQGTSALFGIANQPTVQGSIVDHQAARIINATVKLRNTRTGKTHEQRADASGEFRFVALASGDYELRVDSMGFKTLVVKLVVSENQQMKIEAKLDVGEIMMGGPIVDVKAVPSTLPRKLR